MTPANKKKRVARSPGRPRERVSQLAAATAARRDRGQERLLASDGCNAGSWLWDVKSNRAQWDERYHAMYGFAAGDPASFEGWLERVHPEDQARLRKRIERLMTPGAGNSWDEDFRVLHPTRGLRWMRGLGQVARDAAGRATHFFGLNLDLTRQQQVETALAASETKYRKLHESMTDAFVSVAMEGKIQESNRAYEEMTGYSAEELQRLTYQKLTPAKWHAMEARLVAEQILPQGYSEVYEKEYRRKDGTIFPVELRTFLIRDEAGQPEAMWAIVRDITERKRIASELDRLKAGLEQRVQERTRALEVANQQLRVGELRLQQAAEAGNVGLWDWELGSNTVFYSAEWKRQIGFEAAEISGDFGEWQDRLHPDDRELTLQKVRAVVARTTPRYKAEFRFRHKDGTYRWILAHGALVCDLEGRPQRMLGSHVDITGRKQALDQLQLLVNAVQSTHELISITDHENRFHFVNRAFLDAYGYAESELLGRKPDLLYALANPPGLCEQVFHQTLAGGWQGEIVNRRKDGTEFPIALNTSQIKDGAGRILGLVGVARDISAQKRAETHRTALSLLGHRLSAATTPEQATHSILEIAAELLGWDAAGLHLYSPAEDKITLMLTIDRRNGQLRPMESTRSAQDVKPLVRLVLKTGARLINRSLDGADAAQFVPFADPGSPARAMIYVPIHSQAVGVGVLSIQRDTPLPYTEDDLHLLQTLANHCGAALQRIEVTEALRVAEANYQRIFEEATEGIVQTTLAGRYLSANPAAARMLGYATPAELIASVTDIGRQTFVQPERREELQRLMAMQGFVEGFEVERYRKDGSKIWTSMNRHVVRDAGGDIRCHEGTNQDITARKRAEDELRRLPQRIIEAQEAERLRVARELHDGVNQLLAAAKLRLHKVEERVAACSPAAREILVRCRLLLVQALEDNRRIAHNLHPTDLDGLGLVSACRNFARQLQSRTGLKVQCHLARFSRRCAPAVELNLFRIVQEAFNNIEKHARAKTVRLRITWQGDTIRVRIQDDGRGFAPAHAPSAKRPGYGIGLANIHGRAAVLGGACEVSSAPKQGTTITVCVPCGVAP